MRLGSGRVGIALFVLWQAVGGGCGKIVGIHDTVNDGAGGRVVGSGGIPAGNGGKQGAGNGGRAGGAGGGLPPRGSGGAGDTGGAAGTTAMAGGSGTGGTSVPASGGTTGAAGAKAGGGGNLVMPGSGGAVGGRGAVGSGGVATGGVATGGVATGGVATGGVVGSGGVASATGGSAGGATGSGGVTATCQGSATQCSGVKVQMCVGGQLSMAVDCPAHQSCTGMACACADPVCRAVGPVCATSSSLGTCAQDGACFYQSSAGMACAGGTVCERVAPASCADPTWAEWPLPPPAPTAYTDNKDGTVTDNVTGLMWQSPPASATMSQSAALTYCSTQLKAGGYSDWRLPTKIELASLVDSGRASVPTINNVFTMTVTDFYWTSTVYAQGTANAWYVNFSTGGVGFYDIAGAGNVRCVR